jgi:Flp pilus assembly protein TadG
MPPRQRGAAAIEFALVFPVFFLLFYGLINWGLIFTVQHNLNYAAQHAARAGLMADREEIEADGGNYAATVEALARAAAGETLSWLPAAWQARVLGDGNSKVEAALETSTVAGQTVDWLRVSIRYANYPDNPLLPLMAGFPPVPDELLGQATLRL